MKIIVMNGRETVESWKLRQNPLSPETDLLYWWKRKLDYGKSVSYEKIAGLLCLLSREQVERIKEEAERYAGKDIGDRIFQAERKRELDYIQRFLQSASL